MSRFRTPRWGGLAGLFALTAILCLMPTRSAAGQQVGEVFRDCDVCPEMVVVPAGSFMMGSPETEEAGFGDEGPQHQVTIDYAFAVGVYEVTFDEWDACVEGGGCGGYDPDDEGWGRGSRPVINVHWEDAWQYADWLTQQTGEEYRLLSEAEWEYVARAGTQTARYWGDAAREQCQYANGDSSVGCRDRQEYTASVGSYRPNGFGLYDVLGNVWEWVDDCYGRYDDTPTDGLSSYAGDCDYRVLRGGGFYDAPDYLRSARRRAGDPGSRDLLHGFRVARSVR